MKKISQACHKMVLFLKKILRVDVVLGILLAIIANVIVRMVIPGHPFTEEIIGAIVAAVTLVISLVRKEEDSGQIMELHKRYATICD